MGKFVNNVRSWIAGHRKAVVAAAAGAAVIVTALVDGQPINWVTVILAVLGAGGVYVVPNRPGAPSPPPAA